MSTNSAQQLQPSSVIMPKDEDYPAQAPSPLPPRPTTTTTADAAAPTTVLPALSDKNVTADDLQTTIRVLNAITTVYPVDSPEALELYQDPSLRPLRKALAPCLDVHQKIMYNGADKASYVEHRSQKRQESTKKQQQKRFLAATALRQGRLKRLKVLQQQQVNEDHAQFLVPDGHVDTSPFHTPLLLPEGTADLDPPPLMLEDGTAPPSEAASATASPTPSPATNTPTMLPKALPCYCCKVRFKQLHHFYDRLCPPCADLNFAKRHAIAPSCANKIAIVTGARVKIGYQTVLKLLRSGASVVATTRFPNSAVDAYRREPDFDQFKSRLTVYGLDLRDVSVIEAFAAFLKLKYPTGIDILIHNACQTVRRPVAYYAPLVDREQSMWTNADDTHRQILSGFVQFERARCRRPTLGLAPSSPVMLLTNGEDPEDRKPEAVTTTLVPANQQQRQPHHDVRSTFEVTGVAHSAAMSQVVLHPEDVSASEDVLPPGAVDINGHQLDLRSVNSWVLKIDQVSTPELVECFFVNAVAPFVLNSKLLPLLCAGDPTTRPDRFIVNVSAMEGKFNREYKSPNHPHTNMAKAALNMMTRTSAADLAVRHRIYMNSVDTGWINDENPLGGRSPNAEPFHPPLDEIDAAARILDPIFSSLNGEVTTPVYGKFLKDYVETSW